MRSIRLKRSEAYANFAKPKRRLRSYRLKRFEVYANFAKLSTLIRNFTVCDSKHFESTWLSALNFTSVKVAKLSSQTLRGLRELCEALNSNVKFYSAKFETLRAYVIYAKLPSLNFTGVKFLVATFSSHTLRGQREVCEALNSD